MGYLDKNRAMLPRKRVEPTSIGRSWAAPVAGDESSNQPFELSDFNDHAGFSNSNPSTTLRQRGGNTSKDRPAEVNPGQNEIADRIAAELVDSVVWDDTAGVWFERDGRNAPFRPRPPLATWQTIKRACERHRRSFAASFVSGVETFLRAELAIERWESARELLPLTNGVLDLRIGERRDYGPDDRFNWQLPYAHDPAASCPLIDRTITRMVGGDVELERFLLAWLLVVLLGRADVQAFVELVGDGGTGKSTFLAIARHLVGDENTVATDLAALEGNRFETAAIYGQRLVLVTDSARYRGGVPVLKAITGGDPVRLERKNQQQRRPFVFDGLVMIAANQPLESSDYSSGLSRRRRPIEIGLRVTEEEKAPYRNRRRYPGGFEGALRAEMPGLLNRLLALDVDEAVELVANPEGAMRAQRLAIELETNPLLAWANEALVRCAAGEESAIGSRDGDPDRALYASYYRHAAGRGQHPMSIVKFSRALVDGLRINGIETVCVRVKFTLLRGLRLRRFDDADGALLSSSNSSTGRAERSVVEGLSRSSVEFEGFEGFSMNSHASAWRTTR